MIGYSPKLQKRQVLHLFFLETELQLLKFEDHSCNYIKVSPRPSDQVKAQVDSQPRSESMVLFLPLSQLWHLRKLVDEKEFIFTSKSNNNTSSAAI